MNENLPIHVDAAREPGSITYANEVIAIIAGMATAEVDGVASMTNTSSIADLFARAKPVTKGVKVEVGVEEASVDLALTVEYGKPIQKVCTEVQESVRKAIETMTGLHVVKVDVHVTGVSFERETQEMAQGYVKATSNGSLDESAKKQDKQDRQGKQEKQEPKPAPQVETAQNDDDEIDIDIDLSEAPAEDETEETETEEAVAPEETKEG